MALTMAADLVGGGWDAVSNIVAGIGKGAESVFGAVFPAQQRETVKSETVQAAGGSGQTYRPTVQENQSMAETAKWSLAGWLGSPYQKELSVTAKQAESKQLAETIGPKVDTVGQGLDWAMDQTKKVITVFDQLKGLWEPREVIEEKPREGYPAGKDVQHLNETVDKGANVVKAGSAWVGDIFGQVKGLFNLGFDPTEKQPVSAIQHELDPTTKIGIGVFAVAAVIILILLLRKR